MHPPLQTHTKSQTASKPFQVFWGGPDRPQRILRDILEERIAAVPHGGEILWATYYFRDEALADALLKASERGVRVRVLIEGNPRTGEVNQPVEALLKGLKGLGSGVQSLNHYLPDNRFLRRCRLHEKLYYFSFPEPSVMVGTFNPSGNQPEDLSVIDKIGDQDRGHNVLVDIRDTTLVNGLYEHADRLFSGHHGPWERFLPTNNQIISSGETSLMFFPRTKWQTFDALFNALSNGNQLRMAVSHLNDRRICNKLFDLAKRGVTIEIIAHDTKRRVPSWVERKMIQNGIVFNRYVHPEGLPMHNKFMLFDSGGDKTLAFGSMNLSVRSLHANHELLFVTKVLELYETMESRWLDMLNEINKFN